MIPVYRGTSDTLLEDSCQPRKVKTRLVLGKDLRVGDTLEVWWKPGRDTIMEIIKYEGSFFACHGGARIAKFGINTNGMTIENEHGFDVIGRVTVQTTAEHEP